jgi:4-diphosphocytidyl-2-C-methyl-D-erythritol kinase
MGYPVKPLLIKQKSSARLKLFCPAKINLYLNITGKYPNGFHQLKTIVNRISLADELTIEPRADTKIEIASNILRLNTPENISFKAAQLIQKKCKIKQGFNLHLQKNIPIGAGLGGGSSDAASTLLGINALLKLGLTQTQLYALGSQLGSDVNFFISQASFALLEGRGEKVLPWDISSGLRYLLIYPDEQVSTKLIYNSTKVKLTKFIDNVNIIYHAVKTNNEVLLKNNIFNALEKSTFSVSPKLKKYKDLLKDLGFYMTGSGSAFFSFVNKTTQLDFLKSLFPKSWGVYNVKSF